jgi:outer membrane biogenesis lipoprotein LolB
MSKAIKSFKLTLTILSIALFVTACKSSKGIIASGEASSNLSAKQVIKEHQKKDVDFKTLKARVRIDLAQNGKEQGFTFGFRMEKDKAIWLSAPLGLARIMITPDQVRFYNKGDNTYFDGDYKLLSDFVGFELDFFKVQNILMGQAIYDLKEEAHLVEINEKSYALQPEDQNALLELFYLINPSHFKLNSLQLAQQTKRRFLQIDYASYQEVKEEVLPKNIRIIAVEDTDEAIITMEIKSVVLNEEVRFPFKIPSGYEEIIIK